MLQEIKNGDLTSLMRCKEDNWLEDELEIREKEKLRDRTKVLYNKAGKILDRFPQVPAEKVLLIGDNLFAVKYPHRLTPTVSFVSGEDKVELRMRELVRPRKDHANGELYERYGIDIEVADDSLPKVSRILFNIYPDEIVDWNHESLTEDEERNQKISVAESLFAQIKLKLTQSQNNP